jgi:Predicted nucleic acid-binding protein, contains PIN domain
MELLIGCRNKNELQNLEQFLLHFIIISLNQSISYRATQLLRHYNLSHNLLIPDALIAATSIELGIPLLSKNQRDYKFITELNLLTYP